MNKIKSFTIAAVALCGLAMTSCTSKMNWTVDPQFDRLFGITSLKTTAGEGFIDVEYTAPAGADCQEIQWSKDSLYDDMEVEPADLKSMQVTKSPARIEGLAGDTPYFLRIRSLSDSKECSNWVYPIDSKGKQSVKTLKEQIMNTVAEQDRKSNSIRVTWDASKEVTHVLVIDPDNETTQWDLTPEEKAEGALVVEDLKPSTVYLFEIYNGDALRGNCTASTTAPVAEGDYVYNMPSTDTKLDNVKMKEIAELAKEAAGGKESYSAVIVVPEGATVDFVGVSESGDPAALKIPEGMSVTFFGAAGQKPRVELSKSVDIAGSHSNITFENLIIKDAGCTYVINQSAAASVETLTFKNCEIEGVKSVARIQGSNAISVQSTIMENCIVRNHVDGYSIFHYDNANQSVNSLVISNSTFYNINRGVIQNSKTDMAGGVTVTDCTFNDAITSGRYFVDCNGKNTPLTLKNVIIGTLKSGARGCRTAGAANYENVYQTSDILVPATEETKAAKFSANDMKIEIQEKSAAEIFTDPANGNFALKIADQVGDPRWYLVE